MTRYPSSDDHLTFLVKLQRLLSEGDFTATYKFALLMALADMAVERGHDDDRPLEISMRCIAQKFIEYYWQQTMPYRAVSGEFGADAGLAVDGVLSQNMGTTAKVITDIRAFRQAHQIDGIARAKQSKFFSKLITSVAQTVAKQPVTYLQNIAGSCEPFIYEVMRAGVCLKPGVSSHLRKFHGLIQHMVKDRWVRHIKRNKRNLPMLGQKDDLQGFLFETNRSTLAVVSARLSKLFNQRCFYCADRISTTPDVDHFIPFSMYGRDIAQNFVLAHPSCNRSKSDVLAAKSHLENWLEQVVKHQHDIEHIALDAGLVSDRQTTLSVAKWSYQQGCQASAHAWVRHKQFEPIQHDHVELLQGIECLVTDQ